MQNKNILHIIQGLYCGGSGRALTATAKYSAKLGGFQHRVISLQSAAPGAMEMAQEAGISVLDAPDRSTLLGEIERADIVHLHVWNHPQMYDFLRSELPAMRLLMWFHIAGDKPPQVLTRELVDYADFALACSPYTYEHPVFQHLSPEVKLKKTGMVYGATDFQRLSNLKPKPHDTFNVGYIGNVSFGKMYQNYVPMSAQIDIPNVRFVVCGGGMENYLWQQAQQLGAAERFEFRGFVEDIKSVLEILDVYGYPLREDTYAASELNLQEAMYAGVPPVVFPYGGIKRLVIDNYTGLLVDSELEYKQAIEYLYHYPEERARLGHNAQEYARQIFGAENAAKALNPIYERMMEWQKREREWGILTSVSLLEQPVSLEDLTGETRQLSGAELFVKSLGGTASEFSVSLNSLDIHEQFAAEQKIADASLLVAMGEGGILQYRTYYPNDGDLRLWLGLARRQQGLDAEAISELTAAIELGCNHWRVYWYLAQAAAKVNQLSLAEKALRYVTDAVPDFIGAREMLGSIEAALAQSRDITHLPLRDINLIIFPDWNLSEEELCQQFADVIRAVATHPDNSDMTLLVDSSGVSQEDADLILSGVVMTLLMEEELDVAEGSELSLVGQLTPMQWETLLPSLQGRVSLEKENQAAIGQVGAEKIPCYEIESLSNKRKVEVETGRWDLQ